MTPSREKIEASYQMTNGRITSPGKFEGEPAYVPFLWELLLDGNGDETIGGDEDGYNAWEVFKIGPFETSEFEELREFHAVAVCEDHNGFCYCRTFKTEEELNTFRAECEGA